MGRTICLHVFHIFLKLSLIILLSNASICVHKPARYDEVKVGVHLEEESHSGRQKRNAAHPIRIHVEYEDEVDKLSKGQIALIKDSLLPKAMTYLSDLLYVKQTVSSIKLHRGCAHTHYYKLGSNPQEYCAIGCSAETKCGPVTVPASHVKKCYYCQDGGVGCTSSGEDGPGVANKDFILYVTTENTLDCNVETDTIAHASHCQQEAVYDRPIAGYINICPSALSVSQSTMLLTTVEHEIMHALGFSAALYAFYRDANGNPFTNRDASGLPPLDPITNMFLWSENVVRPVVRTQWDVRGGPVEHTVNLLVTPRVVEEARKHFDCLELEGIELENQGGYGTEITHFEKRLLENEAMTGTHTHDRIFSRLSLAVMEDTGWYQPNYDMADPLPWGKGLGCDFVMKSCKHWMDKQKANGRSLWPYCDIVRKEPFNLTCNVGRSSVALCNLYTQFSALPREYQYFDSLPGVSRSNIAKYGGSSELSDFCPFFQQFNFERSTKSTECSLVNNLPDEIENVAAEYYGSGSRCFHHGSAWRQSKCNRHWTQHVWGAGCHKYQCSNNGLAISIANVNYPCSFAGQKIDVSVASKNYLHTGKLICPECRELCTQCPQDTHTSNNIPPKVTDIPCNQSSRRSLPSSIVIIFLLLVRLLVDRFLRNL